MSSTLNRPTAELRPSRVALFATTLVLLALAAPAGAGARPSGDRDQAAALRITAAWLAIYPPQLWIAPELPGPCRRLPNGDRRCQIAIRLLAWTGGALAPWRCGAHAVLPAPRPGSARRARRTSARCEPLAPGTTTRISGPGRS